MTYVCVHARHALPLGLGLTRRPPGAPPACRSSAAWSDSDWTSLWRDLKAIRTGAFPCLSPQDVLAELCRCMLHSGRLALAGSYLRGTGAGFKVLGFRGYGV